MDTPPNPKNLKAKGMAGNHQENRRQETLQGSSMPSAGMDRNRICEALADSPTLLLASSPPAVSIPNLSTVADQWGVFTPKVKIMKRSLSTVTQPKVYESWVYTTLSGGSKSLPIPFNHQRANETAHHLHKRSLHLASYLFRANQSL